MLHVADDRERRPPETTAAHAVAWARDVLARRPPGGHDLSEVRDSTLDLTAGHGPAVSDLLADGHQKLSAIVREVDVRAGWVNRARRFRLRVAELDDRGHTAGCVVVGAVRLDGAEVPVLVRPCRVRAAGAHDARFELSGEWALDPVLLRRLATRSPGAVADLRSVLDDEWGAGTPDPARAPHRALDRMAATFSTVGLDVDRRLVLAPLAVSAGRAADDLDRVGRWIGEHRVLDSLTLPGSGAARAPAPTPGTESPVAGGVVDAALDDLLALPLDQDQLDVMRLVLAGRHVAVDAPPATGATHVSAAVAAMAAATGRRCLVLAPTRTHGDAVADRLVHLGLAGRVVHGPAAMTPPAPHQGVADGSAAERRAAAAARFDETRRALDTVRDPWQVSRLDVLDALARLDRAPVAPVLDWPGGADRRLPLESVHRVVDAVAAAVELGALARGGAEGPWSVAQVEDPDAAAAAAAIAKDLAERLGAAVGSAAEDLAQLTGTAVATTRSALAERYRLFTGLQVTLDRLGPEVFDVPVDDLVAATGSREYREAHGVDLSSMARRRLVARARKLVRPGVDVPVPELHDLLAAAARQRAEWQSLSGGAGWAHVPPEIPQRLRVVREFLDACRRLGSVHPGIRTADDVDEVVALAGELAAAAAEVTSLPERTRLRQVWVSRGLDDLVDALVEQLRRDPSGSVVADVIRARTTLWRAWWTAVARATNPPPGSGGSGVRALEEYAAASVAHRRSAADRTAAAAGSVASPVPVRVAVPADLAGLPDDDRYDVLVVDDAAALPFAEVVGALSRAVQVVALGDLGRPLPESALDVLRTAPADVVRPAALRVRHRPVAVPLAAGGGPEGPVEIDPAHPAAALSFTYVPGASGLPAASDDHVDTSEAEVRAVVDLALAKADEEWRRDPPGSLAVVALTRTHAAAVAAGLRAVLRARPDLAAPFTADRDEPVVVVSADQARGLERDTVILSVGFPRTPHGRVLHRFGPLDSDEGSALVATAVTRARRTLHLVSGLRSGDLDPARLRGAGSRALSALLAGAELLSAEAGAVAPAGAGGPAATALDDDLLAFPRRGGTGDASWVRRLVVSDLTERGVDVTDGPVGEGLLVSAPEGTRVVVDLDAQFADAASAAARSARLAEGGWVHRVVAVEDIAALRTATAHEIQVLVGGVMPGRRDPELPPVAGRRAVTRGSRRAVTRGTGGVSGVEPAPEDSDIGWGRPPGDPDERLLAERPPHW